MFGPFVQFSASPRRQNWREPNNLDHVFLDLGGLLSCFQKPSVGWKQSKRFRRSHAHDLSRPRTASHCVCKWTPNPQESLWRLKPWTQTRASTWPHRCLYVWSCFKTVASWRMSQWLQHYQCWTVCDLKNPKRGGCQNNSTTPLTNMLCLSQRSETAQPQTLQRRHAPSSDLLKKTQKKQRGTNKMKESPHPVKAQKCSNCTKIQRTQTSQLNS